MMRMKLLLMEPLVDISSFFIGTILLKEGELELKVAFKLGRGFRLEPLKGGLW
jgi:hypothetical protein